MLLSPGRYLVSCCRWHTNSLSVSRLLYTYRVPSRPRGATIFALLVALCLSGRVTAQEGGVQRTVPDDSTNKLIVDGTAVPGHTLEEALRGRVAGLRVVRGSGRPGDSVSVLLRGATSINTFGRSNRPLYVVDGVYLASAMVDMDGLDLASVEVLKGPAATARYGARGANGVLIFRTKRGNDAGVGETRFRHRTEFGWNGLPRKIPSRQTHWYLLDASGNYLGYNADWLDSSVTQGQRALATRSGWRPYDDEVDGDCPVSIDPTCTARSYVISDNSYHGEVYDQQSLFFDRGTHYNTAITIEHNSSSTNLLIGAHQALETGIVRGMNGFLRRGARVNLDHQINAVLDLTVSGYVSRSSDDDPTTRENPFFSLHFYPIDVDLLELNPSPVRRDENDFLIQPDEMVFETNPLYAARNSDIENARGRMLANIGVRWRPADPLIVSTSLGYDRLDADRTSYYFRGFRSIDYIGVDGRLQNNQSIVSMMNWMGSVRYRRRFGDLAADVGVGAEVFERDFEEVWALAQGLSADKKSFDFGDPDLSRVGGSSQHINSFGQFIDLRVGLRDDLETNIVLRRDGSSAFGTQERRQSYFGAGGRYRVSEASWWPFNFRQSVDLLYSFGLSGNLPPFEAQYETVLPDAGGEPPETWTKVNLGNVGIKPERKAEHEFGVEFRTPRGSRVSIVHSRATVEDQVLLVPLAANVGFSHQWRNAGRLTGATWEATMMTTLWRSDDVDWSLSLAVDRTRQTVSELELPAFYAWRGGPFIIREGEQLGTMFGHRWATSCDEVLTDGGFGAACSAFDVNDDGYLVPVGSGGSHTDGIDEDFFGSTITVDGREFQWGMPVYATEVRVDSLPSGGVIVDTTETVYIGNSAPDLNVGISSSFTMGRFSANVLLESQVGGDIYNNTRQRPLRDWSGWEVDQSGKDENLKKPLEYYGYLYDINSYNSHFVEDGTYVKVREVSINYRFGPENLPGLLSDKMETLTISVIGRNLKTWTGYSGYDPEVSTSHDAGVYRFDGFGYPNFRTFTFSVEVEF